MCTRRLLFAAALLTVLLTAAHDLDVDDDDEESDSAGFMIILEHANGWQCAASLVSTRTGVTTARCARGKGEAAPRELWALAAALLGARPAAPLASSARRVTRVAFAGNGLDLADPALDIAVIELEAPFGKEAQAQPILMSTTRNGGESATMCYAIRALSAISSASATTRGGAKRARFRVVNVALASDTHCAGLVPHWSASRSRLLCFTGDDLCERDMGGGVVCDGKLCAVLSVMANDDGAAHCEKTYAAQNIARWRSFLHCAHTLRICGRGTCSEECTEHRLDETEDAKHAAPAAVTHFPELSSPLTPPRASRTAASSTSEVVHEPVSQSIEFEPNRADFKAAPSRTSRPGLKAGEYGDNAAEYGADEPPPARSSPAGADAPSRTPPAPAAPAAPSANATPSAPFAPALHLPVISESTASSSSRYNAASMLQLFVYSMYFL
ncbi:uncharacterized protein LOC124543743 [Vanessa cardui]|uniref:uncharacterized protein LOC124543743 n=1 Tax=Vanessa cardui TaxID=171605 RepID=UPI001F1299FC|nr:uncharacterized protein LOC124543743 [Vanessa cardui]